MNKDIELKILRACLEAYPNASLVKQLLLNREGIDANTLDKEIIYLVGHGLIHCHVQLDAQHNRTVNEDEPVFITSKGIDYLHKSGGLTRMMNFHFSTER